MRRLVALLFLVGCTQPMEPLSFTAPAPGESQAPNDTTIIIPDLPIPGPTAGDTIMQPTPPPVFRIPQPIPMGPGLMVQVAFPLDDVRPLQDYTATLDGQLGETLMGELGWYWLPGPASGTIVVTGQGRTWEGSY